MVEQLKAFPAEAFRKRFGFDKSELKGLDVREVMRKMAEAPKLAAQRRETPKILRVDKKKDGVVYIRYTRRGATCAQRLAKEGKIWKIDAPAACKKEEDKKASEARKKKLLDSADKKTIIKDLPKSGAAARPARPARPE